MRQIIKLFCIPLLLVLSACPSKQDPHTHNLWIKCNENKNSSNITPENFTIEFSITHSSDHQHQVEDPLTINEEEVSKTILWRNNINYATTPYFSAMEISLHINEQQPSPLTSRNIQYHINRSTLDFGYTYTRSDVKTNLASNSGGLKVLNAGKCRRISSPKTFNSL